MYDKLLNMLLLEVDHDLELDSKGMAPAQLPIRRRLDMSDLLYASGHIAVDYLYMPVSFRRKQQK